MIVSPHPNDCRSNIVRMLEHLFFGFLSKPFIVDLLSGLRDVWQVTDCSASVLARLPVSTCAINLRNTVLVVAVSIGTPNLSVDVTSNVTD